MNASVLPVQSAIIVAQPNEYGPLRFTIKPSDLTAALNGLWIHAIIDITSQTNFENYFKMGQTPKL